MGLVATSYKRTYAIPTPRAPIPAADYCRPIPPQEMPTHSSVPVSVGSLGPGVHKVCLSPLSVSGGNRMAESEEKLKSLLMKVKEENEKVALKLNIYKTNIMASGPITSWQIDGETVETVADFIFGGSEITADSDCSPEIKRRLLLGRRVMTNLDSTFFKEKLLCQQRSI